MADAKAADSSSDGVVPNPKARLLDQVREVIRVKHYSIRTEEAYVQWIKRFIFFHGKRHPREMGSDRNRSVSDGFGGVWKGRCLDAEPGLERAGFLFQKVLHIELGEFFRGARQAAGSVAGGFDPGGDGQSAGSD